MATRTVTRLKDSEEYGFIIGADDGLESSRPMRGTMLWFNEVKDCGVILTEEGERLPVPGGGFAGGLRPKGRCAQAAVLFQVTEIEGFRRADEVALVSEAAPRRARFRHRSPIR